MKDRTDMDLLLERSHNINEWRKTEDRTARENLKAHVALIDAELHRRGYLTSEQLEQLDRDLAEADYPVPRRRRRKRRGRTRHYDDRGTTLCSASKLSRHPLLTKQQDEVDCRSCLAILERWRAKPEPEPPEAA